MIEPQKTCRRCTASKALGEFHRRTKSKDGRDTICKPCSKAKTYAWREANPGGHAAVQARYVERNPEKVRAANKLCAEVHQYEKGRSKRRWADPKQRATLLLARRAYRHRKRLNGGSGLTPQQIRELLMKPCHYCGGASSEVEHVVPVSRGGAHSPENVVPACRSCNARKGARTPEEWKSAYVAEGVT